MRRIRRFLQLSWADRWLIVKVLVILSIVRLGLRLVSYERMHRWVRSAAPLRSQEAHDIHCETAHEKVAWAVRTVASATSGTCLPQALALTFLLRRRGDSSRIRFGVAKDDQGQLTAHAWVESPQGTVISDPEDRTAYAPLSCETAVEEKGVRMLADGENKVRFIDGHTNRGGFRDADSDRRLG